MLPPEGGEWLGETRAAPPPRIQHTPSGAEKLVTIEGEITGVTVTELETDHREVCLFLQLACGYSFVCHYPVGFLTNETEQLGRQLFPRLPDSL